ncbi:MAG: MFS transporter [Bacteroidota bacterium]
MQDTVKTAKKPKLGFWDIWNMSFGFLGIQIGLVLQLSNSSRIFQGMGAEVENLAILTIAAPVTGLVVQPIIGYFSDRTWSPRWGRRRPYFFVGAILASIGLILMPNASSLYLAVGTLWLLDTAFNVSMEPFRAFVGDKLPAKQRTFGYAMQSFFIGLGSVGAAFLPTILEKMGVSNSAGENGVPDTVKYAFYIGAVLLVAAVSWTVFRSKEYPPSEEELAEAKSAMNPIKEIGQALISMPQTMVRLAFVQFFSWFALFAMWIYTTPAITLHVFGTDDSTSDLYNQGANFVNDNIGYYNFVAFAVAFLLPVLANLTSRKITHQICLLLGAAGFLLIFFAPAKLSMLLAMVGVGFCWSSILSMPYAILVGSLPENKLGFYVGVFNFFIVIPQIVAASIFGFLLTEFFDKDPLYAFLVGGISFILAAVAVFFVPDRDDPNFTAEN